METEKKEILTAAEAQHAALALNMKNVAVPTSHPEAQWFPEAGLGLFITWGIASVHGKLDLSWAMIANTSWDAAGAPANKVTPEEYWKLADRFDPKSYDPDKWMRAAKAAGFQYAVFVCVHCDGYTMWPSEYSEIGVHTHLGGRDLVGPYVEACRKHGLKVGLYVCPPDWYVDREYRNFNFCPDNTIHGDPKAGVVLGMKHEPVVLPEKPVALGLKARENFHGRTMELLTRYGRIDLLWFDGGAMDNELRDKARALQPHLVINNRSCIGDYNDTECFLPKERPKSQWFETVHCWQLSDIPTELPDMDPDGGFVDIWGYLDAEKFKSAAWLLKCLSKLRGWGANFLPNIGPGPDGDFPPEAYERLAEVAEWMKHSQEAVIGTEGAPDPEPANVPMTVRGNRRYLHLLPGTPGAIKVDASVPVPASARLLRTGEPLPVMPEPGGFSITVPDSMRTALVDVVVLEAR
jgi:alpha-L-fucosidase